MLKHNKKQNVGLLYEFFIRHITHLILENASVVKAKDMMHKYFKPGTELAKELSLFQALHETRGASREVGMALIEKARGVSKQLDQQKLREEKNALLVDVHKTLQDPLFFDRVIEDYKTQATIQVLLNCWRSNSLLEGLSEVTQLEEKLLQHLVEPRQEPNKAVLSMTSEDIDKLVVNIMIDKLNKKFSDTLNENQQTLLRSYVYMTTKTDEENIAALLESIKTRVTEHIDTTTKAQEFDKVLLTKMAQVKSMMLTEYGNTKNVTDDAITFYLGVLKLEEELKSENTNGTA